MQDMHAISERIAVAMNADQEPMHHDICGTRKLIARDPSRCMARHGCVQSRLRDEM